MNKEKRKKRAKLKAKEGNLYRAKIRKTTQQGKRVYQSMRGRTPKNTLNNVVKYNEACKNETFREESNRKLSNKDTILDKE